MLEYREALELFRYDYETGVLYWRQHNSNRVPKTLEAGTQRKSNSDGYLNVSVNGRLYPVHRVVMLMCYGFYGEGLEAKKKYIAQIKANRETIYLGIFDTLEGATEARRQADRKYKFNDNHGEGRAEYVRKKADARLSK